MADATTPDRTTHAHPLARAVMRLLEYRDEADLRFVFAALARRLPPSEDDSGRESALVALERCANALGVNSPSSRSYATWRATSPEGRGSPSVQQIRTLFDGSWNHAIEALPNVPSSDPLVRRLAAIGPRYTADECLAALTRWHQETGELNAVEYKAWARRTRKAEPKARIPANCEPFGRRFGNWRAGLDAAGIDHPRTGRRARTRPTRVTHPTREEVVDSVRLAYEEIGEPFSEIRYVAWRDHRAVQHGASPAPFRVPSPQIITRTFGRSWGKAVTEILGDQLKAVAAMRQRRARFSPTDLARAWWECHQTLGRAPSVSEYERWRHSEAQRTAFECWPPSESSIRQRFGHGSWPRACERLQQEGPVDA